MHIFQLCEMCVLGANKKVKVKNILKRGKIKKKHIHICTTFFFLTQSIFTFGFFSTVFRLPSFLCVYLVVFFKLTPACIVFFFSS